jgi:beta-glucosidase
MRLDRLSSTISMTACVAVAGLVTVTSKGALAQSPADCLATKCPYSDTALPIEQRVKDLVGRMTLEEEVSQTMNQAAAIPRLGVPEYEWWSEALHGVARNGIATNFPQSIGLAATFDTVLLRHVADVIGTEGRAKYNEAQRNGDRRRFAGLTFWSPNINIFRDPRWGRGQETFGEDPYLTSRMGVEFVHGLQGDDPKYLKLVATPKHYAVHSGPEPDRHQFDAVISAHDLEDTYLPAFRASVVEAHAGSVMCAYNAIDGKPACASDMLLQQHLREAWKFDGYVVSDCDSVADVNRGHHFAADNAHASAVSLKAGTDLDCGSTYRSLVDAVKAGLLSKAELDNAVERLFTARFRLGMFDPPAMVPFSGLGSSQVDTLADRQLALQAARESIVLLKNDGTLPLKKQYKTIAVVGPTADLLEAVQGNYNGEAAAPISPLAGIERQFQAKAKVLYAPGSILADGLPAPIPSIYFRPDAQSNQSGLKAEYFTHLDFSGTPVLTRVDAKIDFDWNRISPGDGVPIAQFAVRWTGELLPPAPGDYVLTFRGVRRFSTFDPGLLGGTSAPRIGATPQTPPARYRVFVDGKLLVDSNSRQPNVALHFDDTKPHAVRVEYLHISDDRFVDLEWQAPAQPLLDAAVAIANKADIVVAVVGLSPDLEGEEMPVHTDGFDGGDRTDIALPAAQQKLLEAVAATGRPLVVVLTSGSAVTLEWAQSHAAAILEAWYPGEEGGVAIAETLTGDNNPAGRLPVTVYRSVSDLPKFSDYAMANRTYRYFTGPVQYSFGFGLSYSKFVYGPISLSKTTITAGQTVQARTSVQNISSRAGDEVVELYLVPPQTSVSPRLTLQGYQRIHLGAGEKREVTFQLDPQQLSEVDEQGRRAVVSGNYAIYIGGAQPILDSSNKSAAHLAVSGNEDLPR